VVVATRVSYDAPSALKGEPITTVTLRDPNGAMHEVRLLGGPNRHGGFTWMAETPIPTIGATVPNDVHAWVHGIPAAEWPAAKIPVPFTFQLGDPKSLGASAFPEFDVARRAWNRPNCTAWRASLAARANVTGADDGINAVIWHDDAWPAELVTEKLGQVVLSTDGSGNLEDVDIHMNGADYTWSLDGARNTVDARGVYTHELGHALGLGHTTDITATMYAADPGGENWRSLEQDDFDGVCALYPGAGDSTGCDADACPNNYVCVAHDCERLGEGAELCSPCVRDVGACAGAGSNARCVDIGSGVNSGRVCGRSCVTDADCGGVFHCQATTSSGDFQCVASDACASGPDPCKIDADCNNNGVCKSGACVGVVPPDESDGGSAGDASTNDGGSANATSASGGCSCAMSEPSSGGGFFSLGALGLVAVARRRKKTRALPAALLAFLLGVSSLGCERDPLAPTSSPTNVVETSDVDDGGAVSCKNIVPRIDSLGVHRGKPPLAMYGFDIRLKNPANAPRWLILPSTFTYDAKDEPAPGKGAVSNLEATELSARGRLIWVSMSDPGGFHAVLLPAHATITLHDLVMNAWWTTEHKTAKIDVILAKSISLDEQPIEKYITGNLLTDADAEAQMDADPRNVLRVDKSMTGEIAHAVTFDEECRGYGQAILKLRD
jgi:MYXO-CTERM domain-containing protein